MNLFDKWPAALGYAEFLSRHGSAADRAKWDQTLAKTTLTPEQTKLLRSFTRTTNVLVLAGAWCGDCSGQCPLLERFAETAPVLTIRYLDRDVHADVQAELRINGGNREPVVVFISEDGFEAARYGERTLARYRQLVRGSIPEVPDDGFAGVVRDWLNEFERVQWMLRLSPRLRGKYGD
jgi:hypothetical protein